MPDTLSHINPTVTAMPDSVDAPATPWWLGTHCVEADAPTACADGITSTGKAEYFDGIRGESREQLPGYDSGVMCMLLAVFLFICANYRYYSSFIKSFTQDMIGQRTRKNAFDDRHTVSETRVLISLILLVCLCEGILIYSYFAGKGINVTASAGVAVAAAAALIYYVWQTLAYNCIGYLFGTPDNRTSLLRSFNATQSLLGPLLAVTAMPALFYPEFSTALCATGATLYVVARLLFIYKGFIIFYNNFLSLIYFILYLCAVEIIPPVLLFNSVLSVLKSLTVN